MNRYRKLSAVLLAAAFATCAAGAATIAGTVTNKTTGKPAAGDEVVLLKLGQGMDEAGRAKTDAAGKFTFQADDATPHLVRVVHQGVTYHAQVPPGRSSADIDVYDAAKKLDGITATVQVVRYHTDPGAKELHVTELYAVKNTSSPPKTLMADQTFTIELPEAANVTDGQALSGNGLPVNAAPVPGDRKGSYYFVFPLRPGETRFQINYRLPYTGEAAMNRKVLYPMEHFVVMVPKTMQFSPSDPGQFQSMGEENGANTLVTTALKQGDTLAYKVSGTGEFPAENESAGAQPDNRPGGGLGAPINTPDPLSQYRWYILGGLALAMAGGAFYVLTRRNPPAATAAASTPVPAAAPAAPRNGARPAAAAAAVSGGRGNLLLEALKEELFQLEIERQQGHITQQEYEKAKAALDVTMGRALQRNAPAKTHG